MRIFLLQTFLFACFNFSNGYRVDPLFKTAITSTGNSPKFMQSLESFWKMVEDPNRERDAKQDELLPKNLSKICGNHASRKEKCKRIAGYVYSPVGPSALHSDPPTHTYELHVLQQMLEIRLLLHATKNGEESEPFGMVRRQNISFQIFENVRDHFQLYSILLKEMCLKESMIFEIAWEQVAYKMGLLDEYINRLSYVGLLMRKWVTKRTNVSLNAVPTKTISLSEFTGIAQVTDPLRQKFYFIVSLITVLKKVNVKRYEDLMHWQSVLCKIQAMIWRISLEFVRHPDTLSGEYWLDVIFFKEVSDQVQLMWSYLDDFWKKFVSRLSLEPWMQYRYQDMNGVTKSAQVFVVSDYADVKRFVQMSVVDDDVEGVTRIILPSQEIDLDVLKRLSPAEKVSFFRLLSLEGGLERT